MTLHDQAMEPKDQDDFFDVLEKMNRTGTFLRCIVWALGLMAVSGLSVAAWVWTVNEAQAEHSHELTEIKPRVAALETRAVKFDAAPPASRDQFYELDKRLDRLEQSSLTVREQTAMILSELRKMQDLP